MRTTPYPATVGGTVAAEAVHSTRSERVAVAAHDPAYQAFWILRIAFTIAPIAAGVDKFLHLMVDWDKYLSPWVANALGSNAQTFMLVVGVVEIIAGIGVALMPRVFAYVVAAWLFGIILNLLSMQGYYDIALRDLGLALGAIALGLLGQRYASDAHATPGA